MRKLIAVLVCLSFVMVANADIRLFFSTSNVCPTEYDTQTNPTCGPDGPTTFYLWSDIDNPDTEHYVGVAAEICTDCCPGGTFTGYDVELLPGLPRWEDGSIFAGSVDSPCLPNGEYSGNGINLVAVSTQGLNSAFETYSAATHCYGGDGDLLLLIGELVLDDVCNCDGGYYLRVGLGGIAPDTGAAGPVYFGFGDGSLMGDDFCMMSDLPDIVCVPEPASLLLLGLAGLALRRR